jgi:hypothetical protein
MKRILLLLLLLPGACANEAEVVTTDTREPVDILYVKVAELKVYAQASEGSPVIATYPTSESVTVLEKRGQWFQVRTGDRAGWVRASDLGTAEETQYTTDNPTPRFMKPPPAVPSVTAKGDIYLEADVNTDGDVTGVRLITNTTGNDALASSNAAALAQAKFYPIVIKGERKPFKYYHRVTY